VNNQRSRDVVIYIEVPPSKVVHLQAIFEAYEGIGTVRTIEREKAVVEILTSYSQEEICLALLESLRSEIPWTRRN
jgi:hypothetical protein